jgi:multiple sugar transport system ATP-binding protein
VREPKIFLFDEPLSNLDAELRVQMRVEIAKLHRDLGNTMIYVTHDQVEAMTMADKIVVMRDGHILQVGTPTDLYETPVDIFTARFIGSPSMNMLDGAMDNGVLSVAGAALSGLSLPAHAGKVRLGLRPHDLKVGPAEGAGLSASGVVDAVEPLGAETLVHMRIGDTAVIATAPGRIVPALGSMVSVHADPGALYLFDAVTERAFGRA